MSSKPRSRRSTRKDPWDENVLMTSSKSKLIGLDLVKILANPEAWDCLEEDEKKQILHLLPEHTHPTADTAATEPDAIIPALPQEFLRYSNNWRDGVRQLQVDLECGRYDPEWLSQADEAMKQRADGKFDKWKNKEFEEFWGQKQKLYCRSYAGEATQVKLETLVEHDVVRKGDVWTYARVFYVGGDRGYAQAFFISEKGKKSSVLVEKEVKVIDVVGSTLTFAVPAGQRVIFPHHVEIPEERLAVANPTNPTNQTKPARRRRPRPETSTTTIPQRETRASKRRSSTEQDGARKKRQVEQEGVMSNTNDGLSSNEEGIQKSAPEGDNDSALASDTKATEVDDPLAGETQSSEATDQLESREPEDADQTTELIENKEQQAAETEAQAVQPEVTEEQQPKEEQPKGEPDQPIPVSAEEKPSEPQPSSSQDELVILPNITSPSILEKHILAIDGRFKGVRMVNSWKAIRCHRNNQDMGSLFEVRQGWYLKHDQ
ncbi:hypothetical protein PHISP_03669 [Aspergillus sp. HF37]|nr:hypothetical protein PHISP_03669 [Aspergillus sp. HF37]